MRTLFFFTVKYVVLVAIILSAPDMKAQDPMLEQYIQTGLKNNIVIQQKNISLEKATYALRSAKSLYLPNVAFQMGYSTAAGGRNIDLPVGDMLNGVYSTLNKLTSTNIFPRIENQSINFLPVNFYDAKIRTTVPVINTDIGYNKKITEQQIHLREYEIETYRRELVRDIKTAYYNYQTAVKAIEIYRSSLSLANEGKRVNEKLIENGKGLPAYVIRSNSEIESINTQIVNAEQQAENARYYFNFLLNREPTEGIEIATTQGDILPNTVKALADEPSIANREELKSLGEAVKLNETVMKMNQNFRMPKLNAFLDLGSQSENWKFNDRSRYYMVGLQLDIPIYAGNRNLHKIKQSELDVQNARLNLDLVKQQLTLGSLVAKNNLKATYQSYLSSLRQLEAAETYQRLIDKGYKAGTNTFIETIDARNQLTMAQVATSINLTKVCIASAELERETATFQIKN